MGSNESHKILDLVKESLGMALLDCGCTRTVVGKTWLDAYIDMLPEDKKARVSYKPTDAIFRFGDGKPTTAKEIVCLPPAVIGHTSVSIDACVVENEIPLLLSKASMEKAGVVLDFKNKKARILEKWYDLKSSTSGHFLIPLTELLLYDNSDANIVLHLENLKNASEQELAKKALKLHRNLGHCSKNRMIKLVKKSKEFNHSRFIKSIEKCCDDCKVCEKFRRPPLEPCVSAPLADNFNDVVCMDLKTVNSQFTFLHLIDSATRFSQAYVVKSKSAPEIVNEVYEMWIRPYGCPKKFLSDNGGEFTNELYLELCHSMNVEVNTTAANSGFSNGTVERHNAIIGEVIQKLLDDPELDCSRDLAVSWACAAKNSLLNNSGFTACFWREY